MTHIDFFLGVDPGASGAIMCVTAAGELREVARHDWTEADVSEALEKYHGTRCFGMLEKVNAFPGQGVSSCFKFGASYGFLRGLLISHRIPFETVSPGVWQRKLGCLTRGVKNVSKAKAQEIWPHSKHTHRTSDAALIAEYGRRVHGNGVQP